MKAFYLGVDQTEHEYLKDKIILTNKIALLIGFAVGIPFIFVSLAYFPPLTYIPAVGTVICFLVPVLNVLGINTLSRMVISAVPTSLASVYGSNLSVGGHAVIPSVAMLSLSFSFVMFLVFDIREKRLLAIMGLYVFSIILAMDYLNDFFETPMDTEIIQTGYLAKLTVLISIIVGSGSILILVRQNEIAELKSRELLNQAAITKKVMMEQEESLKASLNELKLAQQKEQDRQWCNEGLTKIAKIIRDHADFSSACDEIISFVVRYLGANQGALFLATLDPDSNACLTLQAAYAYDRKKYIEKTIEIGEGMLGQVYLEKQPLYIKQIPQNYVKITSGLGGANPKSLLLIPLIFNDEVSGVLELASFNEFHDFQIEFLKIAGEDVAAAIQARQLDAHMSRIDR